MKLLSLTLSIILGVNWAICNLSGDKNDVMCGCEETSNTHQKLAESDIKVYTLDSNDEREENNTTKYNFEKYFYGFVLQLNDGVKCVEIKFKDKTMWVYDQNKKIYPVKAYFDTSQTSCLLEFKDLYYSYNLSGSEPKLLNEHKIDGSPPSEFKFFAKRTENGSSKLVEFVSKGNGNSNQPEFELLDYGHHYVFKINTNDKCSLIKHNDNTIWSHEPKDLGNTFPVQFSISKFNIKYWGFNVPQLDMIFFGDYSLVYIYLYLNGSWRKVRTNHLNKLEKNKFKFTTSDGTDELIDKLKRGLMTNNEIYYYYQGWLCIFKG